MRKITVFVLFLMLLMGQNIYALTDDTNFLLADEKNSIDVFQQFSKKVVYVHRLTTIKRAYKVLHHVPAGAGSGIIWDNKGHIVTNYHVIRGADEFTVTRGSLTLPAVVIGAEPRKDLAVLKITSPKVLRELKHFVPFKLISSHQLQVGQKTLAIGNPFGLDHTLTTGVISALGRQVPGVGGVKIRDMIQTDASINPGNSGGPLLDSHGHLIGLNTAIFSNTGSSTGIGFAVPTDDIKRIVPQLVEHGRVKLAGIGIARVDAKIARKLGVNKGVLVAEVLPRTPASAIGLRPTYRNHHGRMVVGDVIKALNGHPTDTYDELYDVLMDIPVGAKVQIAVKRGTQKLKYYTFKTIDIAAY
tara:strand:- start:1545 stop:2618 length:1074 start_codon:yes stop_codon:yes gene_type:complete